MCVCVSQNVKFEVNIGIRAVRNEALALSIQANDQDFYIYIYLIGAVPPKIPWLCFYGQT